MDQALVFADRLGAELAPLTEETSTAQLPIATKPILEHTLEALARAGIRHVIVVISPFAEELQRCFGDGKRWGLGLTYTLSRGEEDPSAIAERLQPRLGETWLALRGDVLLAFDLASWIERALASGARQVWATSRQTALACGLQRDGASDLAPLAWPLAGHMDAASGCEWLEIDAGEMRPLRDLSEFHRTNLDAAAGRLTNLLIPGREVALGLTVGQRSRVSPRSLRQGIALVGARCRVAADAELSGEVVISDDAIVDRCASIHASVVLPHTYVGELVEISQAIVRGNTLIRVDTGAVLRLSDAADAFLMADLRHMRLGNSIAAPLHRALGVVLLVLSLPLWVLAVLAASRNRDGGWRIPTRLRGNRREVDFTGQPKARDFTVHEWNTSIPILRRLPRLLAVISGDLRVVGVPPLAPDEADLLVEAWERLRETAPVGLVGPTQLDIPATAPLEERLMSDAFYARQRSTRRDLQLLLRGFLAVFRPSNWIPTRPDTR